MSFEIIEGPRRRPQRLLVYGPEGIGKSTLASQMPDPIFIDAEDGTDQLPVVRLERPKDWATLLDEVRFLARDHCGASTVVVDTADAAERLCQRHVCDEAKKDSIESWGYGKGYVIAKEEFSNLLTELDGCVASGLNVVVVCHSTMRKFERPDESGAYDRFELKLDKRVAALVKEWADAVLFCDWETFVTTDDSGRAKASGGRRIIRCDHAPTWDAKNRWGLPDTLALDADGIAMVRSHMTTADEAGPAPQAEARPTTQMALDDIKAERDRRSRLPSGFSALLRKMEADDVSVDEVEVAMVARGKRRAGQRMEDWEQPFVDWLVEQWPAALAIIRQQREARAAAAAEPAPF